MDKYNVTLNQEAQIDIDFSAESHFRFTFDKIGTEKLVNEIYGSIYSLQIFPYRFVEYKNGFRIMIVRKKYRVFYKIDDVNKKVIVYRILSSTQNYENII